MSLLYGWDITVPRPGSVESPDSAAEKWLDNFCYLEGAIGVSGVSASELITNGDFTTSVSGWYVVDASVSHSASGQSGSCLLLVTNADDGRVFQNVWSIIGGAMCRWVFYYKCASTSDIAEYGIWESGGATFIIPYTPLPNATSWTLKEVTFWVPAGVSVIQPLLCASAAGASVYYDTVSMSQQWGGHHIFPGVYGDTAGRHILGRSALTYVSASTEIPTGVPNGVWFDTSYIVFRYYHATSGWTEAVDFFPASLPASVFYNLSFSGYGGSVDGRNYAADGAKLDLLTSEARHMVVETGVAGSGDILPWARDRSYVAASGNNLILNGEFGYYPDNYTVLLLSSDDVGHWSTTFTDSSSAQNSIIGSATPASCASAYPHVVSISQGAQNAWKGTGSIYLPGEKDAWNTFRDGFLQISASQDLENFFFSDEPFTIDFRMYFSEEPSATAETFVRHPIIQHHFDADNYWLFDYYYNDALDRDAFSFTQVESAATTINIGQSDPRKIHEDTWYHIALIRGWGGVASAWMVTIDGVPILGTPSYDDTPVASTYAAAIDIGIFTYLPSWFYNSNTPRRFDEFRVSKGVARWTSAFTPPTSAYKYDGDGMVTNLYWETGNAATLTTVSGGYAGSCALVVNGSTDSHIYQDISNIVPEASYRFSFYVKSGSFASGGSVDYYLQFYGIYDLSNSGYIETFHDVSAASVWTQITHDFVAPAGCSAVRVFLGASSGSATSRFDEVTLYQRVFPEVRAASVRSIIDGPYKLLEDGWYDQQTGSGSFGTHVLWSGYSGWPAAINLYHMAFRFPDVRIPRGAIITDAHLNLRCFASLNCNIGGAMWITNQADCASMTTGHEFINRDGIFVGNDGFPSGNFSAGTRYDSANFASELMEITDRPDWDEGNAVGFRIVGPYKWTAGMSKTPSRWTAGSSEAGSGPQLYITYTTSAGEPVKIAESYSSVISTRAASVTDNTKYFWPLQCYLVEYEADGSYRQVVNRGYQFTGPTWIASKANYMTIATLALEEGDIT